MAKKAKKVEAPKGSSGSPKTDELTLWVLWSETESGGEICEGQENDSWPSYEDTVKDAYFKGVYIGAVPPSSNAWQEKSESVTVPKAAFEAEPRTQVYAAIARYRDGGTFSSTSGYVYVGGVYGSYERAAEKVQELEASRGGYDGDLYIPWGGYFSSLESVSVETLQILNSVSGAKKLADGKLADW